MTAGRCRLASSAHELGRSGVIEEARQGLVEIGRSPAKMSTQAGTSVNRPLAQTGERGAEDTEVMRDRAPAQHRVPVPAGPSRRAGGQVSLYASM